MFTSIRANPFLQRSGINWSFIWLRVIPLSFLTLVALIPVFYYIDDSRVDWLPLMALVLFIPRLLLMIRTLFVGIQNVQQDMIQGRWEPLILTGYPAPKIVRRKWVEVVLQTFPDQVLFSLPAIGLSMGISQFFVSTIYNCGQGQPNLPITPQIQIINSFFHSYCYNSDATYYAGRLHTLNPSLIVSVIGIMIIIAFTVFEVSLNASIGTLAAFSRFATKGLGIIYGVVIRFGLLVIVLLSIPFMEDYRQNTFICRNSYSMACSTYGQYFLSVFSGSLYRGYDTLQLTAMPLLDQGTLLAANIMRPSDTRLIRIDVYHFMYKAPRIDLVQNRYDNRRFVLRNLIAAAISTFFYWLLICYFLRRATRFAIVNHGASGYLEL